MQECTHPNSCTIEINGAHLAYDLVGKGPVLVLMHAGICDRRMWDAQVAAFSADHRVLRYDARGFGDSALPPGSFAHHEDLRALLDALAIERAALIAVSMAGDIALKVATTFPQRLSALILSTNGAAATELTPAVKRLWADADAAFDAGNIDGAVEIELRGWVDGPLRSPHEVDPQVRERVRMMNTALWERVAGDPDAAEEAAFAPPIHERLAEIEAPTLLVVGELDQPYIIESMEMLAGAIHGAETVVIRGTAHLPSMERPAEFNQAVLDFLVRNDL